MSTLRNKNANEGVHNDILSFGSMYLTIHVQLLRTKKETADGSVGKLF